MLSVLIPVFQVDVTALTKALTEQLDAVGQPYELLISDVSPEPVWTEADEAGTHSHAVRYFHHKRQLSRAENRNFLGDQARFPLLLFMDADARICSPDFIRRYLDAADNQTVVCGGTAYQSERPRRKAEVLRWQYGRKREVRPARLRQESPYAHFSSFSFMIPREVFRSVRFHTAFTSYGHEDTFLGFELMQRGVAVKHIHNPLIHDGLEDADRFLEKVRQSSESLYRLSLSPELPPNFLSQIRLWSAWQRIQRWHLTRLVKAGSRLFYPVMMRNLRSGRPSVRLLDLYKLSCLVTIQP